MRNSQWDFKEANTKETTHGFHSYPAMLVPQIAAELISEYGKRANILFDPFCGTGTTLVEANLKNINAIGTDLNPLARLISKTKTTKIPIQNIELFINDFYNYLFPFRFDYTAKESVVAPKFSNINFWFTKSSISELAIVKNYIDHITDDHVKDFFQVAFSQTIRECSLTRKNEFKLYRMSKEQLKRFKPDIFKTFENTLAKNRMGLISLLASATTDARSDIYDFDTSKGIPTELIPPRSVDLIITSPPYGDSKTTVAYGQYSRLSNQWLGYFDSNKLDNELMGGKKALTIERSTSDALNYSIARLKNIDDDRCKDVISFYHDYHNSISNCANVIKRKGFVCYVVSNRCVKGITLKTDQITRDFFEEVGFNHINTFERKISNKRMPRKNSPTGITGETKTLMNKEYIVVMQKK